MAETLDSQSVIPLYHQLKTLLREKVESGEWQPGQAVPSELKIAEMFKVSRVTARRALMDLTAEGLFCRYRGKGTFVSPPKIVQGLSRLYVFGDQMRAQGLEPASHIISVAEREAPPSICRDLQLPAKARVVELRRLRLADSEPIILETTWISSALCPGLAGKDFARDSLYGILAEDYGINVVDAEEYFEPVLVDDYEAMLLQVERRSPAMMLYHRAFASGRQPIEVSKGIVRGDRCRYFVRLPRDNGSR
ncbi:MAG: GntR family transcriptional regulator [Bacteroidota bacterium]